MNKIWQKGERVGNKIVDLYTAGDDYIFDMEIFPYDIQASKVHVEMLASIGVITTDESALLSAELENILYDFRRGDIILTQDDEDCHTVIERMLILKLGDVGKKVHTGRSRNDQVLTAVRLYTVAKQSELEVECKALISAFVSFAESHVDSPLPGYTHTQQAMLSTFAHWSLSFAESLLNDLEMLAFATKMSNQNPLGTAAGFGVSFALDRSQTRESLGFEKNIVNSLFAQGSRGKFESVTLEAASQIMLTLSRFATDMLFFTARETGFVKVPEHLTTGSSIMPQKKNLDSMELMRGYTSVVISNQLTMKNIPKGVISGYNRDLQLLKKPLVESFDIVLQSLLVAKEFVQNIEVQDSAVAAIIKNDIFAADKVNEMVEKEGISFRDAYIKVGLDLGSVAGEDFTKNIHSKKSLGSPGNLGLDYYEKVIEGWER